MFRGSFTLTLDEKGRLALPARYREFLLSDCQGHMICTIDLHDPCLLLYPLAEWEEIEEKLKRLSSLNPQERLLQRVLLGNATDEAVMANEHGHRGTTQAPTHTYTNISCIHSEQSCEKTTILG